MTPDVPISIFIAVFGAVLCWILPRRYAIVPLLVSMSAYPNGTMLVPPAAMQLTPQRIIAGVLILRCLMQEEIRSKFKWSLVDTAAAIYFGLMLTAQLMTTEPVSAINNRAGFFLSALVPFWCVRFLVIDRPSMYAMMRGVLWTSVPLAMAALYQSNTGQSPYEPIMSNGLLWDIIKRQWTEQRPFAGFNPFRASAPFQQCIMFGWFFAIQITPATSLFWEKKSIKWWVIPWMVLPLGVLCTVSAGPMMMAGISFMIASLFPFRRFAKIGFGSAIAAYAALTIFAKRAPMEIVASFGLDASSSYYRVNLLSHTLKGPGMVGHWIAGYGLIPPIYDVYHDLCIQWVCLVVIHGLMGVIGFYLFVAAAAYCLWVAKKRSTSVEDEWLIWTLLATLVASLLAMQLVALFGEMYLIYHVFLGLIANTAVICGSGGDEFKHVGVMAEIDGRPVLLRYKLKRGQKLALVTPAQRPSGQPASGRGPLVVD